MAAVTGTRLPLRAILECPIELGGNFELTSCVYVMVETSKKQLYVILVSLHTIWPVSRFWLRR